jgi:dTDP-4-dehydrorhamnose reductase/UDP-glucose 4-epimerase
MTGSILPSNPIPSGRPPEILVIGRNSVLAQAFAACPDRPPCRFVTHAERAGEGVFDGIRTVVNFAIDPAFRREPYWGEIDADLAAGRMAAERGLRFVMLSTRKVYTPADIGAGIDEDGALGPVDAYGRNKLASERALRSLLGDRLTVLRIGNIVGYERVPGRPTFMNAMLDSLVREGRIRLDVSPFVARDFLPVEDFARVLGRVLAHDLRGTWNVGSGVAVEVGRLALWLIEGFGAGELHVTSPRHFDSFRLNIARLERAVGRFCDSGRLEATVRGFGFRLGSETNGV